MTTSNAADLSVDATAKELDQLRAEAEKLRKDVENLKAINSQQLYRLVDQELLKGRIRELEQRLANKE